MNVFIIPSWYPSEDNPIAGIFFKEQATYTAELFDDINIGLSLWGQEDPNFLINKNLPISLKNLFQYFREDNITEITSLSRNLHEIKTPTLHWTHKILGGNISTIVDANLLNLKEFEQNFGKVELIHAHVSYPAGYIAMKLAKLFNVPYIITEHMGPFPFNAFVSSKGTIYPKLVESINNANKTIAVSPKLKVDIEKFGFKEPCIIPNVINDDLFYIGEPVETSPFNFFTLANLSPAKGIDDLLQAVGIVIRKYNNVCFNVGGGGNKLSHYKAKSTNLGLDNHVKWLGPLTRSEARDQYQKNNAFVLPSHGETFGVVYAEAIACGKPIIATRCGGPECIVNEKNGLLADIKNPQDLASKLIYMIENYHKFDPYEIRKGFAKRFSKNAVIPEIVKVYHSIAKKNSTNII